MYSFQKLLKRLWPICTRSWLPMLLDPPVRRNLPMNPKLNSSCLTGSQVIVEEHLIGPELSILAFSDGYTIVPLPAAQDHKRIGDGDTGPNTGGMGAYAPAPIATSEVMERIMKDTLQPTIDGMRREGYPFVGLLFTGFMITEDGPKVLEYNVRFGDPETEAVMLLLESDLAEILLVSTIP